MRPVSATSFLDPADICPAWKSSFTSLPSDPFTTLSPRVDSDSTSSGGSSLEVGEKPVTLSISQVETHISTVLCRVTIRRSINGTSDSSSEFSRWCRHLRTGKSAFSVSESMSESLKSIGAANAIFRSGLFVVGISYSSMDAARRCSVCAFVTEPVNWSLIL